MAITEYLEK
ncbi:hypothetical protein VULLAG_LOCUS20611 [Vulpes lagopus]